MSKTSLFSNTVVKSKNLVEFKAGKMIIDDKNWVHADKRKGLAYVHQSNDGLTHFCWKDRQSGVVEDDLIVFPEDTEFIRIPQCTSGRVYVLKFKNSKKLFLWLQEPKTDKDEAICKKVNDSLNMLPNQTSASGRGTVDSEVQDLLTGLGAAGYSMSQTEIMTLLGMGAGSGGLGNESESSSRVSSAKPSAKAVISKVEQEVTPIAESNASVQNKFKINELRTALSSIKPGMTEKQIPVDLTDVINSASVLPLLDKTDNLDRLASFLPSKENVETLQHIKDNVQCPQMHAAVKTFGMALQSGELAPVVAQFGLGDEVNQAAMTGNVKEFAKVLEDSRKKGSKEVEQEHGAMDESQGDETMDLD